MVTLTEFGGRAKIAIFGVSAIWALFDKAGSTHMFLGRCFKSVQKRVSEGQGPSQMCFDTFLDTLLKKSFFSLEPQKSWANTQNSENGHFEGAGSQRVKVHFRRLDRHSRADREFSWAVNFERKW